MTEAAQEFAIGSNRCDAVTSLPALLGSGDRLAVDHGVANTLDAEAQGEIRFIDLFAGCGGLSLGLSLAGLRGQFAVERDPMAFKTFAANLLEDRNASISKFAWPSWLERKAQTIGTLLAKHEKDLLRLRGSIHILAGGPPCQGFSFAGRREESDPRNQLFKKYVKAVKTIEPSMVILENVPGMKVAHGTSDRDNPSNSRKPKSFYDKLKKSLCRIGYEVHGQIVDASKTGVPQKRSRLIVIGIRSDLAQHLAGGVLRVFELLEDRVQSQLADLGLSANVPASDAISDLETIGRTFRACVDPVSPRGFHEVEYAGPRTQYQRLMQRDFKGAMDSMRLARHREDVRTRFAKILKECPQGVRMNEANRERFGLKKHRIYPMCSTQPAPTITTLPDDVLHYSEPRILTVRECARLQSFPDWFEFKGKYTTGGVLRKKECPRYTQVGNAVPPLLARALGLAAVAALDEITTAAKNGRSHGVALALQHHANRG